MEVPAGLLDGLPALRDLRTHLRVVYSTHRNPAHPSGFRSALLESCSPRPQPLLDPPNLRRFSGAQPIHLPGRVAHHFLRLTDSVTSPARTLPFGSSALVMHAGTLPRRHLQKPAEVRPSTLRRHLGGRQRLVRGAVQDLAMAAKSEPWQGQAQTLSSAFHSTSQPRWGADAAQSVQSPALVPIESGRAFPTEASLSPFVQVIVCAHGVALDVEKVKKSGTEHRPGRSRPDCLVTSRPVEKSSRSRRTTSSALVMRVRRRGRACR